MKSRSMNKASLGAALAMMVLTANAQADAPASSGILTRFESPFATTWIDARTGYRVVVGANPAEFCIGAGSFDVVQLTDVDLRFVNEFDRLVRLMNSYIRVFVYDFLDFDCGRFTTEDPVASGYATVIGADNDVPGIQPGESNANAWGWAAYGEIADSSGNPVRLSATYRAAAAISNDLHLAVTQQVIVNRTN